jgi:hypothetical protein
MKSNTAEGRFLMVKLATLSLALIWVSVAQAADHPSNCYFYSETKNPTTGNYIPTTKMNRTNGRWGGGGYEFEGKIGSVYMEVDSDMSPITNQYGVNFYLIDEQGSAKFDGVRYKVLAGSGGVFAGDKPFIVAFADTPEGFLSVNCNE